MKKQRQLQIGEKIKRYLGQLFIDDTNLIASDGNNITINQVDISPDLKNMKIIIDSFSNIDSKILIKDLNELAPYIRKKIAQEINLRYVPNIKFVSYSQQGKITSLEKAMSEESLKFHKINNPDQ